MEIQMDTFAGYDTRARQPADDTALDDMDTEVILRHSDDFIPFKTPVFVPPCRLGCLTEEHQEQQPIEFHDLAHPHQLGMCLAEPIRANMNPPSPSATSSDKRKRTRKPNKHGSRGNNNHGRSGRGRCMQCRRWKQAVSTWHCHSRLRLVSI